MTKEEKYQRWLQKGWITPEEYNLILKLEGKKFELEGYTWTILVRRRAKKSLFYIYSIDKKKYGSALFRVADNLFVFDLRLGEDTLIPEKKYFIFNADNGEVKQISEVLASSMLEETKSQRKKQSKEQKPEDTKPKRKKQDKEQKPVEVQ